MFFQLKASFISMLEMDEVLKTCTEMLHTLQLITDEYNFVGTFLGHNSLVEKHFTEVGGPNAVLDHTSNSKC